MLAPPDQAPRNARNLMGGMALLDGVPRRHFRAILADPPWHFRARSKRQHKDWTSRRDAEHHYRVMGLDEIKAMPVGQVAAADCHLFLWATGPHLPQALETMKAWGFRYSGIAFMWAKLRRRFNPLQLRILPSADSDFHVGLGFTTRKNCEFVLLGRRGNCKRRSRRVRELVLSPVREHSRKPDEVRERIEEYCEGPYLEMFARSSREGWTAVGDEVGKFSP